MIEKLDHANGSDNVSSPKPTNNFRFSLIELMILVAIIGIMVAFLLPDVPPGREATRRNQCRNNLTQIALALQGYARDHHALPPAYTTDANGKPLHSWRTLILPYVEEQQLFDSIDFTKPWDDPANAQANKTHLSTFQCPSVDIPETHTTYLAIVTPNSCLQPTTPRALSDIKDGASQTWMIVEVDAKHAVPWMAPADADENIVLSLGEPNSRSPHPVGLNAAFVDGHVEFFSSELPADQRRALISIAGNDNASTEDKK